MPTAPEGEKREPLLRLHAQLAQRRGRDRRFAREEAALHTCPPLSLSMRGGRLPDRSSSSEATAAGDGYFEYGVLDRA
jgi:hypothetical protein